MVAVQNNIDKIFIIVQGICFMLQLCEVYLLAELQLGSNARRKLWRNY